jgi:uncharacterized membrane protein YfcA
MKLALFVTLACLSAAFVATWYRQARRRASHADARPDVTRVTVGAVTNVFDTLGIGSFATTTALFRFWRLVPDRLVPGTLNVGHTLPAVVQAFIFITIIAVELRTLALLIAAAVAGAWLGAGYVAQWPRRTVLTVMGVALLAAAGLMTMAQLQLFPTGGDALGLAGPRLAFAVACSVGLGALMTMGVGFYAPCMILVALLGMNPKAAFPIMMGACAFLMPVASMRFVRAEAYDLRAALGLALGGVPAVLLTAFLVKSLPLTVVRWLVVVVVVYTAASMLAAALRAPAALGAAAPRPAP